MNALSLEVILPRLGVNDEEAIIVQWLAAPGEEVAQGQPIAVIETIKATVELAAGPSWSASKPRGDTKWRRSWMTIPNASGRASAGGLSRAGKNWANCPRGVSAPRFPLESPSGATSSLVRAHASRATSPTTPSSKVIRRRSWANAAHRPDTPQRRGTR